MSGYLHFQLPAFLHSSVRSDASADVHPFARLQFLVRDHLSCCPAFLPTCLFTGLSAFLFGCFLVWPSVCSPCCPLACLLDSLLTRSSACALAYLPAALSIHTSAFSRAQSSRQLFCSSSCAIIMLIMFPCFTACLLVCLLAYPLARLSVCPCLPFPPLACLSCHAVGCLFSRCVRFSDVCSVPGGRA